MFDDNTKQAWQTIQPDAGLKERVLNQKPKKITPFPTNLVKTAAAVAACLIIAVNVMGLGQPILEVGGQPIDRPTVIQSAAAFSREIMPLSVEKGITLELTVPEGCDLAVSGGTLDGNLWTVEEPGEYLLRAIHEKRTQYYLLSFDGQTGLWSLRPED